MSSIKQGLAWSAFDFFGQKVLQLLISIILARLLTPEDFGIVGIIFVFLEISQAFISGGIGETLIREESDDYKNGSAFVFNFVIAAFFFLLINATAKPIADFYDIPELKTYIHVISFTLLINAFIIVPRSILTKELQFKELSIMSIISTVVSGGVAIYMAFTGYGVWSLVARYVLKAALNSALLLFYVKWVPFRYYSYEVLKPLVHFSTKLLFSNLLAKVQLNLMPFFIGKQFGIDVLGYYNRAYQYQQLVCENIYSIINRVAYPSLVKQKDNLNKKKLYRNYFRVTTFFTFPFTLFFASISQPLIVFLLGEKWVNTVPIFEYLCFEGLLYPLHSLNLSNLKVYGKGSIILNIAIFKALLIIPVLIIGYFFGLMPMLYAHIAKGVISYFINSYYSGKFIDYSYYDQLKDLAYNFGSSFFIFFMNKALQHYFVGDLQNFVQILILSSITLVVYFVLSLKNPVFQNVKAIVMKGKKKTD